MRAPFSSLTPLRAIGLAVLALLPLGGTAWFAMGQLQPVAEPVARQNPPTRPSYLVAVREPTAEELAQRRALAEVTPDPTLISLALQPDTTPEELSDKAAPQARVTTAVNMRSGPTTDAAVLRIAAAGEQVRLIEERDGWSRIALASGEEAWVASRFLEPLAL